MAAGGWTEIRNLAAHGHETDARLEELLDPFGELADADDGGIFPGAQPQLHGPLYHENPARYGALIMGFLLSAFFPGFCRFAALGLRGRNRGHHRRHLA